MWDVDPMRYRCLAVLCSDDLVLGRLETRYLASYVDNDGEGVEVAAIDKMILAQNADDDDCFLTV